MNITGNRKGAKKEIFKRLLVWGFLLAIIVACLVAPSVFGQDAIPYEHPGTMVVLFHQGTGIYLQSFPYDSTMQVTESKGKLYVNGKVKVRDLDTVGWGYYHFKEIYEELAEDDLTPIDRTITELGLIPLTEEAVQELLNPRDIGEEIDQLNQQVDDLVYDKINLEQSVQALIQRVDALESASLAK